MMPSQGPELARHYNWRTKAGAEYEMEGQGNEEGNIQPAGEGSQLV
jgi:hypothetical protein